MNKGFSLSKKKITSISLCTGETIVYKFPKQKEILNKRKYL